MLDPEWLDRFVEWLTARGVHVYAVLDAREAAEAQARFASQRRATAFERPVLIYEPAATALFDLSNPGEAPAEPLRRAEPPVDAADCHPPVSAGSLVIGPTDLVRRLPRGDDVPLSVWYAADDETRQHPRSLHQPDADVTRRAVLPD
jgi:hypothetical protein